MTKEQFDKLIDAWSKAVQANPTPFDEDRGGWTWQATQHQEGILRDLSRSMGLDEANAVDMTALFIVQSAENEVDCHRCKIDIDESETMNEMTAEQYKRMKSKVKAWLVNSDGNPMEDLYIYVNVKNQQIETEQRVGNEWTLDQHYPDEFILLWHGSRGDYLSDDNDLDDEPWDSVEAWAEYIIDLLEDTDGPTIYNGLPTLSENYQGVNDAK